MLTRGLVNAMPTDRHGHNIEEESFADRQKHPVPLKRWQKIVKHKHCRMPTSRADQWLS